MLMNKPMKGPVKKHEKVLNYLFNSLHFLVIFHMKILNVLNKMLNMRLLIQFRSSSLLPFEIMERRIQPTDQYLANTCRT